MLSVVLSAFPYVVMVAGYAGVREGYKLEGQHWIWHAVRIATWLPAHISFLTERYWLSPFIAFWNDYSSPVIPSYWLIENPYLWLDMLFTFLVWAVTIVSIQVIINFIRHHVGGEPAPFLRGGN